MANVVAAGKRLKWRTGHREGRVRFKFETKPRVSTEVIENKLRKKWRARRDSNSRPSGSKLGGGKSQTPYRPLLAGLVNSNTAPQLGYIGLQNDVAIQKFRSGSNA
jgi:hypothetical protein